MKKKVSNFLENMSDDENNAKKRHASDDKNQTESEDEEIGPSITDAAPVKKRKG